VIAVQRHEHEGFPGPDALPAADPRSGVPARVLLPECPCVRGFGAPGHARAHGHGTASVRRFDSGQVQRPVVIAMVAVPVVQLAIHHAAL
jgi:hypothetical protein